MRVKSITPLTTISFNRYNPYEYKYKPINKDSKICGLRTKPHCYKAINLTK